MEEKRDSSFQEPRQEREESAMCLSSVASPLLVQEKVSDIIGTCASEASLVSHARNLCILEAEAGRLQAGTSLGCVGLFHLPLAT